MIRQVTDHIWRGPRPPDLEYLATLRGLGVEVVIDLEWYIEDWFAGVRSLQFLGMTDEKYPMMPLRLWPDRCMVDGAVRLMMSGVSCYVHCREGVDRTGIVVAAYRIHNGWSHEAAITEMLDIGFHRYRYWLWLEWMRRYGLAITAKP